MHLKVAGSVPGQGTYLGCRFHPWPRQVWEATNQSFFLTSVYLSLSLSLPPSPRHWPLPLLSLPLCLKKKKNHLAGVAQWIERGLQSKGLPVRFPVRAHVWVAGQVPSGGHTRGNHTLIFLSLSPSLPLSLKINQ